MTLDVFPRACKIAGAFRSRGIPVVAGGVHVTCSPGECAPHFDALCVGPAERVWAKILRDAEARNLQNRYEDQDEFRGEEIASPAYGRIDRRKYLYTNVVTTSRGCPQGCDFCYNSNKNRLQARRPIPDVIRDIGALKTRHVYFVDDNFIGDPDYTRELLRQIKKMDLKWNAAVTTRILDHLDLLDLMVETGCQSLFIGFESLNNTALANVHKVNHPECFGRLADELHQRGIMVNASMVFGLDGDGPDVFKDTLDWLVAHRIETMTAHILTPYPGTRLYAKMAAEGRIEDYDLAHYNTSRVVFQPTDIEKEALYWGYLQIYREFYSLTNIWRRRPQNSRQKTPYFLFNIFYRKYGRTVAALCRIIPLGRIGFLAERLAYGKSARQGRA